MAFYKIACPFFKCEYLGEWEKEHKSFPVCRMLEVKDSKGRARMDIVGIDCTDCKLLDLTYTKRRKLYYHYFPEEAKKKSRIEIEAELLQDEKFDFADSAN